MRAVTEEHLSGAQLYGDDVVAAFAGAALASARAMKGSFA